MAGHSESQRGPGLLSSQVIAWAGVQSSASRSLPGLQEQAALGRGSSEMRAQRQEAGRAPPGEAPLFIISIKSACGWAGAQDTGWGSAREWAPSPASCPLLTPGPAGEALGRGRRQLLRNLWGVVSPREQWAVLAWEARGELLFSVSRLQF